MSDEETGTLFSANARSLPYKNSFRWALVFGLLHYLALVAMLTLAWLLVVRGQKEVFVWFLGAVGIVAFTWVCGYVARRSAKCPLCRGTPLLDTAASKHKKAIRLPFLPCGTTALIHLILTHRFRCMYCGTPFDFNKRPPRG